MPVQPRLLIVCPQSRDLAAIEAARLGESYRIELAGTDLDELSHFDPKVFLAGLERLEIDGVVGTKDRSALLASLLAERKGCKDRAARRSSAADCAGVAGGGTARG